MRARAPRSGTDLQRLIARMNRIRREHQALQTNATLRFHGVDSDQLIVYSKVAEDRSGAILVVANLDPFNVRSGWTDLSLGELGIEPGAGIEAVDLLTGDRFPWRGAPHLVKLRPPARPAPGR